MLNKRTVGTNGEERALSFLQDHNARILDQNYRNRCGEIDLILKDRSYLVFLEVKYRKNSCLGAPQEAVTLRKQKTICLVADIYLLSHHVRPDTPIRFDVLALWASASGAYRFEWIKNAFPYRR